MRAVVFDGPKQPLRLAEVPDLIAGPGQALVRVRACGVCGSDLHATQPGGIARPGGILGHEVAGEIATLGPDPIGDWAVGDRVFVVSQLSCGRCGWCLIGRTHNCENLRFFGALGPDQPDGAYAEHMLANTGDLLAVPDSIELEVAALVEPLATGLMLVRSAELAVGDRVLVMGAGPIGLTTALWARFFGARRIVVSEPVAHRREMSSVMGATDTIDAAPFVGSAAAEGLKKAVVDVLGQRPDAVIECVGRPGVLRQAISVVRQRGTVIAGGVCMPLDEISHLDAYATEPTLRFPATYTAEENAFIIEMIAAGRIDPRPLLSHRVTLDELPRAFESLRTPTDQCKVIVTP